jgi:hypothetical protein
VTAPRDEVLLGFDARRVDDPVLRASWGEEQRRTYLLRDSPLPLSADTLVWPNLFRRPRVWGGAEAPGTIAIPRPDWVGANDDFWEDLGALRAALTVEDTPANSVIAATWHPLPHLLGDRGRGPIAEPTNPSTRDPAWAFLGFDVMDAYTSISGLSNCGYDVDELPLLRAAWGPKLNAHHLFDAVEDAAAFALLSDRRVTEHAPFHVIGLWKL